MISRLFGNFKEMSIPVFREIGKKIGILEILEKFKVSMAAIPLRWEVKPIISNNGNSRNGASRISRDSRDENLKFKSILLLFFQ